ncbi:MAG: MFS transporter [Legionella sp.]
MNGTTLLLFKERYFLPLFLTQFFSAFNDNAFKLGMLTLISFYLSMSQPQSEFYQLLAGILFIIPFFIFSATAGQLADKYDKAQLIRIIKLAELILIAIGSVGFYLGNVLILMVILLFMGIHSTFFGPIKYAILPDHLPGHKLLAATALIEGGTFIAILLGTILGTIAVSGSGIGSLLAIFLISAVAVSGFYSCFYIPSAPPVMASLKIDWHLWRATLGMLKTVVTNKGVTAAILAISWFWLIGGVVITKLPDYVNYVLHANTRVFAVLLALFSIGITTGSIAISQALKGHLRLKFVPFIMLSMSLFAGDLFWATPNDTNLESLSVYDFYSNFSHWRVSLDLFLLAFCGGLFIVPLYTYLQLASEDGFRASTIAANNIINALFMVAGIIIVMILLYLNLTIPQVFLILAILNICFVLLLWRSFNNRLVYLNDPSHIENKKS